MKYFSQSLCGFAARAANVMALRQLLKQRSNVGPLYNFQMFVGRVSMLADYCLCGVEDGDALFDAEGNYLFVFEAFVLCAEMLFVAKENLPHDTPHVVLWVGVEEIHAPPFFRWRKTT